MNKFLIWIYINNLLLVSAIFLLYGCSYIEKNLNRKIKSDKFSIDFYFSNLDTFQCPKKFQYIKQKLDLITSSKGVKIRRQSFLVQNKNCYASIFVLLDKKHDPKVEKIIIYSNSLQKSLELDVFSKITNKNIAWGREYTWNWSFNEISGNFTIKTYLF